MRHNSESGNSSNDYHLPVLHREIISYIEDSVHKGRGYLADCTLGEGGHSEIILKRFKKIKIIAFERDGEILDIAKKRLSSFKKRIKFINENFSSVSKHLETDKNEMNYCLYDFGISSYHLDRSKRGFVFSSDEFLDMRLDKEQELKAYYVVNRYNEKDLRDIIYKYGEERFAKRISSWICRKREEKPIETTKDLSEIVLRAIPKRFHVKNIHPATRVFQGIRIEVNNELDAINKSLSDIHKLLNHGGRLMAISFHSLEDRIVKNRVRRLSKGCTCDAEPKHCQCTGNPIVKILTKKPVRPLDDEVVANKRARSAKLRVCEKI